MFIFFNTYIYIVLAGRESSIKTTIPYVIGWPGQLSLYLYKISVAVCETQPRTSPHLPPGVF